MSRYQATETCGCGASITVEVYGDHNLMRALVEFRNTHKHIESSNPWGWGGGSYGVGTSSGGSLTYEKDEEE